MDVLLDNAKKLLSDWKGNSYTFGRGVLPRIGSLARKHGKTALLVCNTTYMKPVANAVASSLEEAGVTLAGGTVAPDAGPNAPREDVYRLESYILHYKPDCVVAVGGGSTIDACKASAVLAGLGAAHTPEIEAYFGTNMVTEALKKSGAPPRPGYRGADLREFRRAPDQILERHRSGGGPEEADRRRSDRSHTRPASSRTRRTWKRARLSVWPPTSAVTPSWSAAPTAPT